MSLSQNDSLLQHRLQRAEAENQRLRAEYRQLKARLDSSASGDEPGFSSSQDNFQLCATPPSCHDRHGAVPRIRPGIIVPSRVRQPDRSQDASQPLKRAKTVHVTKPIHNQASPSPASSTDMARSKSSACRSDNKSGSYMPPRPKPVPSLPVLPSPTGHAVSVPAPPNPMLADFISQDTTGQPASAFVCGNSLLNAFSRQGLPPRMAPTVESGREYSPGEYISMLSNPFVGIPPDMEPPASLPNANAMPMPAIDGLPAFQDQHYLQSGLPSTCGSLTSGPTLDTSMSRQNSQAFQDNLSLTGNLDMMRVHSQHSAAGNVRHCSFGYDQLLSPESMFPKGHNELLHMGANLADSRYSSLAPSAPHQAPMVKSQSQSSLASTSSPDWEGVRNETLASADMQRTESNQSGRSLKLRAKEALQRQNANAAIRNIQPKPLLSAKREPPTQPQSAAAKAKEGKAAIAKAAYQRPKHPKVYCQQCPEDTEGFRGEHELRRHTEAKHKSVVRKFICVEPEGEPPLKVFKSLKDCKQCTAGKPYGAYYNAAAHLRRTHFKQKTSRKQNSKNGSSKAKGTAATGGEEKLGGKGGGDWPPMHVLKLWMRPINVSTNDPTAFDEDPMEPNELAEQLDDMAAAYDQYLADAMESQATADAAAPRSTFPHDSYVAGVGGGFAAGVDMDGAGDGMFQKMHDFFGPTAGMDPVDPPTMFLHARAAGFDFDMPAAAAGVHDFAPGSLPSGSNDLLQQGGGYTSPVSSTATITPVNNRFGGGCREQFQQILPVGTQAAGNDMAEMSFDMAFDMPQA